MMYEFDKRSEDKKIATIEKARKHLSEIMIVFRQAKDWLKEDNI